MGLVREWERAGGSSSLPCKYDIEPAGKPRIRIPSRLSTRPA